MPYLGTSGNEKMCPTSPLACLTRCGHNLGVIPNNLQKLRKARKVTQDFLAEQAGTTRNYYGKLERGERPLTMEYLERLANALEVEPFVVIAPDHLFPSSEELADMLRIEQQQLPAGLPYSEWPRVVAAALHLRLQQLGGDRANEASGDAPD